MHHPTDRIAHTTAFVTPVVEHWLELEIAQWMHHGQTLLPQSYISLLCVTMLCYGVQFRGIILNIFEEHLGTGSNPEWVYTGPMDRS